MSKVYMMVTITNRQLRNQFQDLFEKNEMAPVFGALGRGTADSTVLDYFGLEASEKAVYFSIVTESMWKQLRRELIIKMQIDVPEQLPYRDNDLCVILGNLSELHLSCQ